MGDDKLKAHAQDVRRQSCEKIVASAQKMLDDPDNSEHCRAIYDCLQSYIEAELTLNPAFFGD